MEKFDTHKFLFTLNHNNEIKGKKIVFTNRENKKTTITLKKIEIGASPVSCKLYDTNNKRYLVPFMRIIKVYNKNNNLIWDNTDINTTNTKIIKGFK